MGLICLIISTSVHTRLLQHARDGRQSRLTLRKKDVEVSERLWERLT